MFVRKQASLCIQKTASDSSYLSVFYIKLDAPASGLEVLVSHTKAYRNGPIRRVDDFRLKARIVPVLGETRQSTVETIAVIIDREAPRCTHVGAGGDPGSGGGSRAVVKGGSNRELTS